MFIELAKSEKNKKQKFLENMEKTIPWEMMKEIISPYYYKKSKTGQGRAKTDLELMLRIYLLQQWFGLSDPAMESAIYDSIAFKIFLKIDFIENAPDETTILNFRHFLEQNKLQEKILETSNKLFEERGLLLKKGTIVDATIVKASSSTKNKEKKRDPEMSSTRKNNNYYFGMKIHVGVDVDSGIVHTVKGTTAKISDKEMMKECLHGEEKALFGDKGYIGKKEKIEWRKANKFWGILDKATTTKKLSSSQKKRNKKLSSVRAKVEHFFLPTKRFWGHAKTRYRGIEKNTCQWIMLAVLFNFQKYSYVFSNNVLL